MAQSIAVLLLAGVFCAHAEPLKVAANGFEASFDRGALTSLKDAAGNVLVGGGPPTQGLGIHRVGADHWAQDDLGPALLRPDGKATRRYQDFTDLPGASVVNTYEIDAESGDLLLTQTCESPQPAVWGVEWAIGTIPLDMNIIIPGRSGIKLTEDSPGASHTFDYPIGWEAQLVIVEGESRGFYVWAEDAVGRFKRLTVNHSSEGWRLGLTTINYAPFDDLTTCESTKWRLNVYEGDWRVPARRYRDWMVENLGPTRVEDQQPAWVEDIRCVVIMGMDISAIEALTERLDPEQTLLYVPSWRRAGYDRDYPAYDDPFDQFEPFVKRAHELGYRVMPHVNYFGVDPLNPLYEQFEPFQCRSPWGNHDKLWWLWERADPIIKFAYINPAHKPWRELFISRMKELCERYDIDALHLDQTLVIYNDHNGPIDGQTMIQGNIALHRELREALPGVALSGEGLNEITCLHEAFAQRHAWGISHTEGTWNRSQLRMAHPISSYLLRPHTIIYGYLGCAPPTSGQLYAAWNEAYQHWGVIPTLKPNAGQIENPVGFSRQFYDETRFWQEQRVDIDMDSAWPADVFFPLRTAGGERAARTADHRLMWGDREISRTITGVAEVRLPGTIPGWRAYDRERIFGLDPSVWYPYTAEPRDMDAFHVEALPAGFRLTMALETPDVAVVRTEQTGGIVADLADLLDEATCGSKPFDGEAVEVKGPIQAEDGGQFVPQDGRIFAHPPWKAERKNPETGVTEAGGTGIVYARYPVTVPAEGSTRFVAEVAMEKGAVGEEKTDGVTYGVTVRSGGEELHAELHNATDERRELTLDLTPLAGQAIELELSVHPGPNKSATFDWARWFEPRVEQELALEGEMTVASARPWNLALSGTRATDLRADGNRYAVPAAFPGAAFLLRDAAPLPVTLPFDVATAALRTTFVSDEGTVLDAARYAGASPGEGTVAGVTRSGIAAHPPDHGRTIADLLLALPDQPAEFRGFAGLREGSKSEGCLFIVEANGQELARELMLPGEWQELSADLSPWAGKMVILSLITDSDGGHYFDWAHWGEPTIRTR